MLRFKKIVYVVLGSIGLVFGIIGMFLPVIPTVPFFMLAAIGFSKSSKKIHTWFTNTKMYKKNLESYVEGKGMTLATKRRIMTSVSLLMLVGFVTMWVKNLYLPCGILFGVWVFHIFYFVFGIKTLEETAA